MNHRLFLRFNQQIGHLKFTIILFTLQFNQLIDYLAVPLLPPLNHHSSIRMRNKNWILNQIQSQIEVFLYIVLQSIKQLLDPARFHSC